MDISRNFGRDNGGAIPPNLLQIPNSESSSTYHKYCKLVSSMAHPARFPSRLPEFFISMLTDPDDIVLDIFAGSNTTGWVAENMNRQWIAFEENKEYVANSTLRFAGSSEEAKHFHSIVLEGMQPLHINRNKGNLLFDNVNL